MRWLLAAVLLMVAAPAYAQQNDAEKLYRTMEKKIASAKSLKVACDADGEFGGAPAKMTASTQLADGNKARIDFTIEIGGMNFKVALVADGKQLAQTTPFGPAPKMQAAPANLNKILAGALARAGVVATAGITDKDDLASFDLDKKAPISDFKMGAKDKVGKADAQIIEYIVTFDGTDKTSVKLWIDTKTNLPLKRQLFDEIKKDGKITETYTEFVIDPQLDAKVFELPK
ncbi:MAG TPA: hypothetical protein VE988_09420 [Gemmataceae bacterium]|nr:hypothetical protein [Gemmataceae bacterium]